MQFEILLAMQVLICLLILVLLRKIMQIRQQVSHVIKEVEGYIAFITEETEEEADEKVINDMQNKKEERIYQSEQGNKRTRLSKDDAQTKLIQSVLGEYFP